MTKGDRIRIIVGINTGAEGLIANVHPDQSIIGVFDPVQLVEQLPRHPKDGLIRLWLEPGEYDVFGNRKQI